MKYINIAIDGPAGAGKSSISKIVSKRLGFIYIDTGAMYRSVALFAIENGIDIKNETSKLISVLDSINIDMKYENDKQIILLNGRDVSDDIRKAEVSIGASDVAVIKEVRLKLVELQRKLASNNNVVMDGRDIGTYVLPDAQIKIYLTASVEDRAKRRYDEMVQKGMECDIEKVKLDIMYRDKNDSEREFAPLRKADDATVIDTSGNEFEESVELLYNFIKERL